jgi:hypothetical protein
MQAARSAYLPLTAESSVSSRLMFSRMRGAGDAVEAVRRVIGQATDWHQRAPCAGLALADMTRTRRCIGVTLGDTVGGGRYRAPPVRGEDSSPPESRNRRSDAIANLLCPTPADPRAR